MTMKEFSVFAQDVRITVKVVRDELHDTDRYLVVVYRINDIDNPEYRLVESYKLMDIISSYLR